ncbi:helix-turn-helix domain-containing protein [Pseudomonas sp. PDNC002]|nr:helix-turn-helix domain-containing protein [Pseudomonas sp. PDNC002]
MRDQIGGRLRRECVRLGFTVDEVTARVGCSRRTWQYYETGASMPNADLLSLLDGLGFDILYVITGRGREAL